jgi:hypothetical protein
MEVRYNLMKVRGDHYAYIRSDKSKILGVHEPYWEAVLQRWSISLVTTSMKAKRYLVPFVLKGNILYIFEGT